MASSYRRSCRATIRCAVLSALYAVFATLGDVVPAGAQQPQEELPGKSPAGSVDRPTPKIPPGQPRQKPQIDREHPSSPNLPAPEPLAPKKHPGDPPSLPGSGRRDVVPGS